MWFMLKLYLYTIFYIEIQNKTLNMCYSLVQLIHVGFINSFHSVKLLINLNILFLHLPFIFVKSANIPISFIITLSDS